jgi:hypothetical protein
LFKEVYIGGAYTPALSIEYLMEKPPVSSQADTIAITAGGISCTRRE